jgi:hypothetical protein
VLDFIPQTFKKHHFQLLEVMIALFLVTLCAIPLIYPHVRIYQEQKQHILEAKLDHEANVAYGHILVLLYEKGIPWVDITSGKQRILEDEAGISFPCTYVVSIAQEKNRGQHYMFQIDISLTSRSQKPLTYTYFAFVEISNGEQTNEAQTPALPDAT